MRNLDVAIYDASGNVVRWRGGGAGSEIADLRFSSGLPGGFLEASFVVEAPAARLWPVEAGHTCIIRRGHQIVWWGWVEDVERTQRGNRARLTVTCYGPWTVLQQRRSSPAYTTVESSAILITELGLNCTEISADSSQIANSGVPLTIDWDYHKVSEIVEAVCAAGNASDLALLFAIWEPAGSRTILGNTGNLAPDYSLELGGTEWEFSVGENSSFLGSYVHSGLLAAVFSDDDTDALKTIDKVAVSPSTAYILDYWHYWSVHSGMTVNGRLDWYTSGNVFISSTYLTTYTATGAASAWTQRIQSATSPGTAAFVEIWIQVDNNGSSRWTAVDDIKFYLSVSSLAADAKPRAYLWSRDLSGYDYVLRTAGLDDGVRVVTTTRDLANYVVASYGSGSYTAAAQDASSQAAYRRRDEVAAAGSVGATDAAAVRDVYLARHKDPGTEVQGFSVGPGMVRTATGQRVDPALLRAGDRLLITDGRLAGSVVMLESVVWENGLAQCRPEGYEDATRLLARVD